MGMRYRVDGFAETRDALSWALLSAPKFKFGLTPEEVFAGIEAGYDSVRANLKDAERIGQLEASRAKLREAFRLHLEGDKHTATRTLQEAQELFVTLRRIGGKTVSRQVLGETSHGANEVDE